MYKRIIWIILDSVGIGALPDAENFGDKGSNTLGHIFKHSSDFDLPNMRKLGLGNIDNTPLIQNVEYPIGIYGKAGELSIGKDTTVGHWEMTGVETKKPFPTYPKGFPDEIIDEFIKKTKINGILGNKVSSGTEILEEFGQEHINSKKPIIYTSSDSVFQIACHENVFSLEDLYKLCEAAREILSGENNVARVIARPFVGDKGSFVRTANRKDFSVTPNKDTLLDKLNSKGIKVIALGKISDIFCGRGIYKSIHTDNNIDGINKLLDEMAINKEGLMFINLVDFDSQWGHRRDIEAYANGLKYFDDRLDEILSKLTEDDLLIINADHGCDPTFKGTDHTREYIPILMYGIKAKENVNLHILDTFADIGQTIAHNFGIELDIGKSRLEEIWENNTI